MQAHLKNPDPLIVNTEAKQVTTLQLDTNSKNIPEYVLKTLEYIIENGTPPKEYVGGRNFQNREKRLKQKNKEGQKILYKEWDVHPKVKGISRGAERLITGSDLSAYYTNDHYKSFIQIK
ncbi:MAG: ribonuclease [Saprospiraceae bacterium]|nr:ribonuclease [Saprospiraceae bacterium]